MPVPPLNPVFNLQVGVEHDDPAGEERERQLGAGGLDLGHGHRSGRQSGSKGYHASKQRVIFDKLKGAI